jgi:endonuclease YncB( thermonuclease family)
LSQAVLKSNNERSNPLPFILIKGTYRIDGYSPDGDSIRFEADDPNNWDKLAGPTVALNARHHAQLRLEGIDTLETHYQGFHQPLAFAQAATDFLLTQLGFATQGLDVRQSAISLGANGSRGYILSRTAEMYGRPVSFVLAGDSQEDDGSKVFLTPSRLEQSVNFKSLQTGNAYPTYYTGLFGDLREKLTSAVAAARASRVGIWPDDKTNTGFEVADVQSVTDTNVILPKLFRRIVDYIGNGGIITGFKQYLESKPDPLLDLHTGHFTNLDTYVEVTGISVKLTVEPEKLVFME